MTVAMDGFDAMMEGILQEEANPQVPAGMAERVLERVAVERWSLPDVGRGTGVPALMFQTVERVRADERGRSAPWIAGMLHVAAMLAIGIMVRAGVRITALPMVTEAVMEMPKAMLAPAKGPLMGGGGGQRGPTPATKGMPPKAAEMQIVAPKAPPMDEPKIHVDPTVEMQDLKMMMQMVAVGAADAPLLSMSMGNGTGGGLGGGNGNGVGPGSGGGTGGGPRQVGGGVSQPELVFQVEPEFSEEARRARLEGNVLVNLWVDAQGRPTHVRVAQGIGMGLDEKAVEAVKQYRFKPAMENGRPVMVEVNIDVTFHIF